MELKTKVTAEEGSQDILITREFNLPVALLFKAYTIPELVEQWMGSKVLKMENRPHGCYQLEKKDEHGNVVFAANGTIHECTLNTRIVRTFEMANAGFDVQLEYLEFEALTENTSRLVMQTIFRNAALRNRQLQMPFAQGINWAHNMLEQIMQNAG